MSCHLKALSTCIYYVCVLRSYSTTTLCFTSCGVVFFFSHSAAYSRSSVRISLLHWLRGGDPQDDPDALAHWSTPVTSSPRAAAAALWAIVMKKTPEVLSSEEDENEEEEEKECDLKADGEFDELERWLRQQSLVKTHPALAKKGVKG